MTLQLNTEQTVVKEVSGEVILPLHVIDSGENVLLLQTARGVAFWLRGGSVGGRHYQRGPTWRGSVSHGRP